MKPILILFLLMTSAFSVAGSVKCNRAGVEASITLAKNHSKFDKNMHCSTSCMLAIKCTSAISASIGIVKEIRDLFGKGNAEIADLKANRTGISIANSKRARNDLECLEQCDLYY